MDSYSTFKGLHFSFLHQCSRTKFFLTPRGIFYAKIQMSENQTKIENILTHWSVAQAGSNDEKNGGRKSCWTVLLINILNLTSFASILSTHAGSF